MGTDGEGTMSGDDRTRVEASAECLLYEGELSLDFSFFTMTRYRVFILCYEYPMSLFSLRIYKGNERMGI
jgi:hypothetical protein